MPITFHADVIDDVLFVTTTGHDESLQQVIDYATAVMRLADARGARRVLCDERALVYSLDTLDTFDLAKLMARVASHLLRVAVVCLPRFLPDGRFWEDVAVNRGLQVRVDVDLDRAWAWVRG